MPSTKRTPTLADWILEERRPPFARPLIAEFSSLQARLRKADRFVLDTDASTRVGEVLRDIPELLVEQLQFARAPFDLCWVEYDFEAIFRVLNPERYDPADKTADQLIGILIDHDRITTTSRTIGGDLTILPWVYHLNTEWPVDDQLRFCEIARTSRMGIDQWLWGSVSNHFREIGRLDLLRSLRDVSMVQLLFSIDDARVRRHLGLSTSTQRLMTHTTGDLKNHVAVLLMLNQPSLTKYIDVPRGRGWLGNRPGPYLAHRTVTVSLDAGPKLRAMARGDGLGQGRRRHDVRGCWCHDKRARNKAWDHSCIHDWRPATIDWELLAHTDPHTCEHWLCLACQGKRWWRVKHERGDLALGRVTHEYRVRP